MIFVWLDVVYMCVDYLWIMRMRIWWIVFLCCIYFWVWWFMKMCLVNRVGIMKMFWLFDGVRVVGCGMIFCCLWNGWRWSGCLGWSLVLECGILLSILMSLWCILMIFGLNLLIICVKECFVWRRWLKRVLCFVEVWKVGLFLMWFVVCFKLWWWWVCLCMSIWFWYCG